MTCLEKIIYYHDTDCGGVVYYANYLKYLEEGRTEFLRSGGISLKELTDKNIFFVVANLEVAYKSSARYQDKIQIFTEIEEVKTASIRYGQTIKKGETTLVEAKTTVVCISSEFKPKPLPPDIKKILLP